MSQPIIIVHYLENSRATQFIAFLEELSIPYTLKIYKRNAKGQAPPELRTIHPLGKAPVLELQVPGQQSITLAEQSVMIEYLCDYFGQHLIPPRFSTGQQPAIGKETDDWKKWKYFMAYTEGSFNPYVLIDIVMQNVEQAKVPFFIKPITQKVAGGVRGEFLTANLKSNLDFLEAQLKNEYICGKLTGADFMLVYPLEKLKEHGTIFKQMTYPKTWAYVARMTGRASWVNAERRIAGEMKETKK